MLTTEPTLCLEVVKQAPNGIRERPNIAAYLVPSNPAGPHREATPSGLQRGLRKLELEKRRLYSAGLNPVIFWKRRRKARASA